MSFSENLRAVMERGGVSQSELARRLGIRSQAVNQWLKPGGTAPRGARLHEIATALGVGLSELLAETPGKPPDGAPGSGYGLRLAATRKERGETAAAFAAALGVPIELLLLWEAEELALDHSALVKLWQAGISADWLLFGDQRGRDRTPPTKPHPNHRRRAA
jgi:transcriptional regulator with XRE-family HTH domain